MAYTLGRQLRVSSARRSYSLCYEGPDAFLRPVLLRMRYDRFATQFCFVCKTGFPVKVSSELFQQGFDAWKASKTSPDTSSEAYRTSNSYTKDKLAAAANRPTAPEAWYAHLATDQTIVPSALARIMPV